MFTCGPSAPTGTVMGSIIGLFYIMGYTGLGPPAGPPRPPHFFRGKMGKMGWGWANVVENGRDIREMVPMVWWVK